MSCLVSTESYFQVPFMLKGQQFCLIVLKFSVKGKFHDFCTWAAVGVHGSYLDPHMFFYFYFFFSVLTSFKLVLVFKRFQIPYFRHLEPNLLEWRVPETYMYLCNSTCTMRTSFRELLQQSMPVEDCVTQFYVWCDSQGVQA